MQKKNEQSLLLTLAELTCEVAMPALPGRSRVFWSDPHQ